MEIFFVRHGETKGNKEKRFRGRTDYPLNENGRRQARKLKKKLEKFSFDKLFTSPLKRAYETAEIIKPNILEINVSDIINNVDVGDWSNVKKDDVEKNYPELFKIWINNPEDIKFPNGESIESLYNRAGEFLDNLVKMDYERVLIVSHRSIMKCMFAYILGMKENYFWKFYFNNASYSTVNYSKNRGYLLTMLNESCHLDGFVIETK